MPRGDKSAYTDKQKRQAEHIEESEREQGRPEEVAERIAWATVNKHDGCGKKAGSGRGGAKKSATKKAATKKASARKATSKKGSTNRASAQGGRKTATRSGGTSAQLSAH